MATLLLQKDGCEIVPYDRSEFPVHARVHRLLDYPDASVLNHWHQEVEFNVVRKGVLLHCVNGKERTIPEGDGIFVNAGRLHASRSLDGADCEFLCLVLPLSLLSVPEALRAACFDPFTGPDGPSVVTLRQRVGWQGEVLERLLSLYGLMQRRDPGYELKVLGTLFEVWYELSTHEPGEEAPAPYRHMEVLGRMMGYIRSHSGEKPTLEEIAAAGNVSKSGCCAIFREALGESPVSYLTRYRLEKSIELLRDTSLCVTQIALSCGFCSASYYTEIFRRKLGCTPSQYRKAHGLG